MTDDPFMVVADHFAKLVEVSGGHRARAIAAGFSPEIADQMALQVHMAMIAVLSQQMERARP
jgi:hypothetical protein